MYQAWKICMQEYTWIFVVIYWIGKFKYEQMELLWNFVMHRAHSTYWRLFVFQQNYLFVCVCVRIFTTNLFHRCTFCPPHANVKLFSVQANKFQFCHIDFLWLIFVECEHFVQCNTLTCNTYSSTIANSKSTMKCWRWF